MASNAAMEVTQLLSKHLIKPSSPTPSPQSLKCPKLGDHHSLSFASSLFVPLTLLYPAKPRTVFHVGLERAQSLKQSLSQSLTRFYPLAGRIRLGFGSDQNSLDCDDSGVLYVEARVKCHMSKFLKKPDFSVLLGLITDEGSDHVAKIQVSIFECGGIAVSVLISQLVEGSVSMSGFLKDWAGASRGFCGGIIQDFSADFRPNELNLIPQRVLNKGKGVTRRLIFDSEAIASLKAITMSSQVQNPSAIEAVSSLIWKCTMNSLGTKLSAGSKSCALALSSSTRRMVTALCKDESRTDLDGLVQQLRGAITQRKNRGLVSEHGHLDYLACYGWCTSGIYEVDFGWGRPAWVTSFGSGGLSKVLDHQFLNSVVLVETRWGDGIEAWVTLDAKVMADLVRNQELLTFASISS